MRESFSASSTVGCDLEGRILEMWTSKILTTNPTIAKAYATLLATQMANHLLISTFILEGETQLVILAIKEKFLSPI